MVKNMSMEIISIGLGIAKFLASREIRAKLKSVFSKKGKTVKKKDKAIVVLEIGRPIIDDVQQQLGDIDAVVSVPRSITKDELHKLTADIYKAIKTVNKVAKKIVLVLSGPQPLAFMIGQSVGFHHFDIDIAWWQDGEYIIVEDMTKHRDMLF